MSDRISPKGMKQVINEKIYRCDNSTLLASLYGTGTSSYLYRSPKGQYFMAHMTIWEGHHDTIQLLSDAEAKYEYECMEPEVDYKTAFGCEPEEG